MQHLFTIPADATTIGETSFKNHYARVNKNMNIEAFKVEMRKVVRDIIMPAVTKQFYEDLAQKFNSSANLSEHENEVLQLLQDAIAEYTIWRLSPQFNVTIADKGIHENHGTEGSSPAASMWRYKNFHWSVMLQADKHLDMALTYLDENSDEFDAFLANRAKFHLNNFLVRSTRILEKFISISGSRRTFKKLIPAMLKANQRHVLPILSKSFHTELLEQLKEENLSQENEDILPHVQAVICHAALYYAIPSLTVMVEADGIFAVSSTDGMNTKQMAQESRIEDLKDSALKDMNQAIEYLRDFLYVHKEDYPTWMSSDVYQEEHERTGYPLDMKGGVFLG